MPNTKRFLDEAGLKTYHKGVTNALDKKESKIHIGNTEPTDSWVTTWIDVGSEADETSLLSEYSDELIYEEPEEELIYNDTNI